MQYWRLANKSADNVKFSFKAENNKTSGIILKKGEFCVVIAQQTATIDAQVRRNFLTLEENFDNSKLKLEIGKSYDNAILGKKKSKLEEAEENAVKYIRRKQ